MSEYEEDWSGDAYVAPPPAAPVQYRSEPARVFFRGGGGRGGGGSRYNGNGEDGGRPPRRDGGGGRGFRSRDDQGELLPRYQSVLQLKLRKREVRQ